MAWPRRNLGALNRQHVQRLDRGRRQGAQWWFITPDRQMINYAQFKERGGQKHDDWLLFRSGKEAKRWIALRLMEDAGLVRHLRRQVDFPLMTTNPQGLQVKIGAYRADFVYEEPVRGDPARALSRDPSFTIHWETIVEDVKPSGGLREELYLWKRRHMVAQYGIVILET